MTDTAELSTRAATVANAAAIEEIYIRRIAARIATLPRIARGRILAFLLTSVIALVVSAPPVLLRTMAGSCACVRRRPRPIAFIWPSPAIAKGSAGPGSRAGQPTKSTCPAGFAPWQG